MRKGLRGAFTRLTRASEVSITTRCVQAALHHEKRSTRKLAPRKVTRSLEEGVVLPCPACSTVPPPCPGRLSCSKDPYTVNLVPVVGD